MCATAVTHGGAQLLSLMFPDKIKCQIWAGLLCRNTFTPYTSHHPLLLISSLLPNSPPSSPQCRGSGDRGYSQFRDTLYLSLLPPHALPLLHFRVTPAGSNPPLISPMWVFPMSCSSSPTALAWVPSTGCSPSGTGCSMVDPPRGHKSCQ